MNREKKFSDIVILAGGFGERLWPASRPDFPKQFMTLQDGTSFLQEALLRAVSCNPSGKILIISRPEICETLTKQVNELKARLSGTEAKKIEEDCIVVAEPCSRHTCAPLLLSCKLLKILSPGENHSILVLASDHVISPIENFVSDCQKASEYADKGKFVCFAIPPTEPSTGYGYIKSGKALDEEKTVFEIDNFKEKPDAETAVKYLESGEYAWNSGMFGFTSSFFENEIKKYESEMYESFKIFDNEKNIDIKMLNSIKYISDCEVMTKSYSEIKSIAVDNAVAERTDSAVCIKSSFKWDDVGSWDAMEKLFDDSGNDTVSVKSRNNFVYSDLPVALCGVEDLIVVAKNGKILVMKKGTSGDMRSVVKQYKDRNDE